MIDPDGIVFLNRLRSLFNIDADRLPELDADRWPLFRDDPPGFFMRRASDTEQAAIWREVMVRQRHGEQP